MPSSGAIAIGFVRAREAVAVGKIRRGRRVRASAPSVEERLRAARYRCRGGF
ncbi:MAG: hypothetical protein IPJ30_08945 [Acidobacteria bacterium]|nr:hypothetical protein [Acidobacteriota bacterium]